VLDYHILAEIISRCPDGIMTFDQQGLIVLFSHAAEKLTGYRAEEVENRMHISQLCGNPDLAAEFLGTSPGPAAESPGCQREVEIRTREGESLPAQLLWSHVFRQGQVVGSLGFVRDLRPTKRLENKVKELSLTDQLTGLFNRRHFYGVLRQEVHRAQRYARPLVLCGLDLDNFSRLNETLGHFEGDNVLRFMGQLLRETLRMTDLAFRYGGDEFMLIMPETSTVQAMQAITRLRKGALSSRPFGASNPGDGSPLRPLTFSLGLAQVQPGEDTEALIKRTEQALVQAKRTGGNRAIDADASFHLHQAHGPSSEPQPPQEASRGLPSKKPV